MNGNIIKSFLIITSVALSMSAQAAGEGPYMGARSDRVQVNVDGLSVAYAGIRATGGVQFSPNFAVEAHLGTGVSDAKINGFSSDLGSYYGADLVGKLPVTEHAALVARIGYGAIEIDGSTDTDLRYGVGASYVVARNIDVSVNYERWFAKDGYTIDNFNAGVNYKF